MILYYGLKSLLNVYPSNYISFGTRIEMYIR